MRTILVISLLLLGTLEYSRASDGEAENVIKKLGPQTMPEDLNALANNPIEFAGLLINELAIVPENKILAGDQSANKKAMHIIWCIRALRSMTGLDFTAPTGNRFSKRVDEQTRNDLLKRPASDDVRFFAVWMSRDSIYVAPADAQEKIIKRWKEWYARNGQSHRYTTNSPLSDWYF
jgi:hypothetical protein